MNLFYNYIFNEDIINIDKTYYIKIPKAGFY